MFENLLEFLVAALMSLVWVAYYQYDYNIGFFNSAGINWLAFSLWTIGLLVTLRVYRWLKEKVANIGLRLGIFWLAYFSTLLGVEFTGYYILRIREITTEPALCFGLIHGTPVLKIYYLVAGLGAVFLYHIFKKGVRLFQDILF